MTDLTFQRFVDLREADDLEARGFKRVDKISWGPHKGKPGWFNSKTWEVVPDDSPQPPPDAAPEAPEKPPEPAPTLIPSSSPDADFMKAKGYRRLPSIRFGPHAGKPGWFNPSTRDVVPDEKVASLMASAPPEEASQFEPTHYDPDTDMKAMKAGEPRAWKGTVGGGRTVSTTYQKWVFEDGSEKSLTPSKSMFVPVYKQGDELPREGSLPEKIDLGWRSSKNSILVLSGLSDGAGDCPPDHYERLFSKQGWIDSEIVKLQVRYRYAYADADKGWRFDKTFAVGPDGLHYAVPVESVWRLGTSTDELILPLSLRRQIRSHPSQREGENIVRSVVLRQEVLTPDGWKAFCKVFGGVGSGIPVEPIDPLHPGHLMVAKSKVTFDGAEVRKEFIHTNLKYKREG